MCFKINCFFLFIIIKKLKNCKEPQGCFEPAQILCSFEELLNALDVYIK